MRRWQIAMAAAVIAGAAVAAGQAGAARGAVTAATGPATFRSAVYVKNPVSLADGTAGAAGIGKISGTSRNDLVVVTPDLNNKVDGKPLGTAVALFPELADGRLATPLVTEIPDRIAANPVVILADLYGNGQQEIVLASARHLDVFTVSHGRLAGSTIPLNTVTAFAVANFNGDKYPDLLVMTNQSNVTQVWTGSASHKFTLWRTVTFPHGLGDTDTTQTIAAADLDRNGLTDVVMQTGHGFAVRLQTKRGVFGPEKDYQLAPVSGVTFSPSGLVAGDVTGDGYPDVIVSVDANSRWAGVEVFAGTRGGTLKAPAVHRTLDIPWGMAVASLTGNGRSDLIVAHASFNAIGVLAQQSPGQLAAETLNQVTDTFFGVPAVGDLNGDGKPDIATATAGQDIAILYAR